MKTFPPPLAFPRLLHRGVIKNGYFAVRLTVRRGEGVEGGRYMLTNTSYVFVTSKLVLLVYIYKNSHDNEDEHLASILY